MANTAIGGGGSRERQDEINPELWRWLLGTYWVVLERIREPLKLLKEWVFFFQVLAKVLSC